MFGSIVYYWSFPNAALVMVMVLLLFMVVPSRLVVHRPRASGPCGSIWCRCSGTVRSSCGCPSRCSCGGPGCGGCGGPSSGCGCSPKQYLKALQVEVLQLWQYLGVGQCCMTFLRALLRIV